MSSTTTPVNPFVGTWPDETCTNIASVLVFLQAAADVDGCPGESMRWGQFLILEGCVSALCHEAAARRQWSRGDAAPADESE